MAVTVFPRLARSKASRRGIRWSHPLAQDLSLLLMMESGFVPVDLVRNRYATPTTGLIATGLYGPELVCSAVSFGYVYFSDPLTIVPANGEITIAHWQRVDSYLTTNPVSFGIDVDTPNRCSANIPWNDSVVYWDYGSIAVNRVTATHPAPVTGPYNFFVFTSSAKNGTVEIYINGRLASQGTSPASSIDLSSAASYNVGAVLGIPGTDALTGAITYHAVWRRALSYGEIKHLTANPFGMLSPSRSSISVPSPPSVSGFTANLFFSN